MNFTPQQKYSLLSKMGYSGSPQETEMDNFIQSNPGAAAKMGKFDRAMKRGFAQGGLSTAEQSEYSRLQSMSPQERGGVGSLRFYQLSRKDKKPKADKRTSVPSAADLSAQALKEPSSLVTTPSVDKIKASPDQFIAEGTGQVGEAPIVEETSVAEAEKAEAVETTPAATFEAKEVAPDVDQTLEELKAVTADPTKKATVKGQLESLMEDFEGGETPPWASGAMRQATSIMQQRGLGASSIAGQAITQAAIEAALPIAQADAATAAQFELQSMNNEQQTTIFKTQQKINSLLSDQAAINAAEQFNAASENQTNQFFADLQSTVSRFNADQINAIAQFNAGEKNAIAQFNSNLQSQRDQFNANNRLVVAQANAKWRQEIATLNTMAQNEANMQTAKVANGFTTSAIDNVWQRERDLMSFAWQSSENELERNNRLLLSDRQIAADQSFADQAGKGQVLGEIAATAGSALVKDIFGGIF